MSVLLDTDALSELFRAKNPTVVQRANAYLSAGGRLRISTITEVEIARGWHQAGRPERAESFRAWLKGYVVLPLDSATSWLAGEIAGTLGRAGREIGLADVCIAATAIQHGLVLVTGNTQHHERVRAAGFALRLDNWREPASAE